MKEKDDDRLPEVVTSKEQEEALWALRMQQDGPEPDQAHVCPWQLSPAAESVREYLADGLDFDSDLYAAAAALEEVAAWLRTVARVRPFGQAG